VTNLVYLGLALLISLIGCLVLWLRNRRPRSMEAHIQEFAKNLRALAPDRGTEPRPPGRRDGRGRRSG
jgi:hypothetical protein